MGDPLSIASGIAGLLALAASTAQGLITLIADIRDAPSDILDLNRDTQALTSLLSTTKDIYDAYSLRVEDQVLAETFADCLQGCLRPMEDLTKLLESFKNFERGSGRRSPMRMLNWTMRKGEIRGLRDRLRDGKASLTLAVSVFNGHVTGKGQDEIRHDISLAYERLHRDFLSLDNGVRIREKLKSDLESVSGRRASLSDRTDAGLPMRKFLETQDEWEHLTVPDSLPPSDALTADDDDFTLIDDHLPITPDRGALMPPAQSPATTSLLTALFMGDQTRVRELLSTENCLSERTSDGQTALHVCAELNDQATAGLLLDHGIDINIRDTRKRTAFTIAVDDQSTEVACLLIQRGCSLGNFASTLPNLFQDSEDCEWLYPMVKALATRSGKASRGPYLLHRAVQQGQTSFLKILLEEGFDPNVRDEENISALHYAIVRRNMAATRLLVDNHADLNAYLPSGPHPTIHPAESRDYTPLLLAASVIADPAMITYLIEKGANPNFSHPKFQDIVLQCVCAYDIAIGKALIKGGTNVNHQSVDGHTVLYWSIYCHNIPLLELILAQPGVDVNVRKHHYAGGETAAHVCVEQDRRLELKILLRHRPDVSLKDAQGRTPLQYAIEKHRTEMVRMLEEYQENKNCARDA